MLDLVRLGLAAGGRPGGNGTPEGASATGGGGPGGNGTPPGGITGAIPGGIIMPWGTPPKPAGFLFSAQSNDAYRIS